ncbi:hypothetical protein A5661_06195 [Mycobacterium asiaticum]|nr:hypothetical protein A5661_06195 [Mycobacterium asiaticum]
MPDGIAPISVSYSLVNAFNKFRCVQVDRIFEVVDQVAEPVCIACSSGVVSFDESDDFICA